MRGPVLLVLAVALALPVPAAPDLALYVEATGTFAGGFVADLEGVNAATVPFTANACHRRLLFDLHFDPPGLATPAAFVPFRFEVDVRDASGELVGRTGTAEPGWSRPLGTLPSDGLHTATLRLEVGGETSWVFRLRGLPAAGEPLCSDRVVVNEVEANPPGTDSGAEWVELLNVGIFPVDLSTWLLSGTHGTPSELRLPEGTVLAPGERLVVTFPSQALDNVDEIVVLRDAWGGEVDRTPALSDRANDGRTNQRTPDGGTAWRFGSATAGAANG